MEPTAKCSTASQANLSKRRLHKPPAHSTLYDGYERARRAQWLGHILRMDESRMVHKAGKLIHTSRTPGDLLMDAPDYTWEELKQLAANRDSWRNLSLVNAIKGPRVHIQLTTSPPRANQTKPPAMSKSHPTTRPSTTDNSNNRAATASAKYRARDTHEMFFRRPRFQPPRKKKTAHKPPPLTDKQRQQFARDHYQLHHGTTSLQAPSTPSRDITTSHTSPILSTAWSPNILGHHQSTRQHPNHSLSFTTTPNTNKNDSTTLSAAWSPKILGYHHHPPEHLTTLEQTIPFTPTNMNQFLSYICIDYLEEIRNHGNPANLQPKSL